MTAPNLPEPTPPLRSFRHNGLTFRIYQNSQDMGAASAHALAVKQIELAPRRTRIGFMIMAAPSAFAFYEAYVRLAALSPELRDAIAQTDFFQFDDYPLSATHPATFRYLLNEHFFSKLKQVCSRVNFHPLDVDANPAEACRRYTERVLASGPDLQLKGVGENGHWGYHEPGVPLDDPPAFMAAKLSAENAAQQLRDHPALFRKPDDVPSEAYTANVTLFLRTRACIEDNVPQASKAFALLAAYGTDIVSATVPSSALKRHPSATVCTTAAAAWALEEYIARGAVTLADVQGMAVSLGASGSDDVVAHLTRVLVEMGVRIA